MYILYIHSNFNLSIITTSPQWQSLLKRVPTATCKTTSQQRAVNQQPTSCMKTQPNHNEPHFTEMR